MKSMTLVLVLFLSSQFAFATDINGNYNSHGYGGASCGKIIAADNLGNNQKDWRQVNTYETYLTGYLTAYNINTPFTYDILSTDMSGAWAFIIKYCRENPLNDYADAIMVLTGKLYPKRIKEKPSN